MEIESRKDDLPISKPCPREASVALTIVENVLLYSDEFDDIAPNSKEIADLTDEHFEKFVKSFVANTDSSDMNPSVTKKALTKMTMRNDIYDAKTPITHYYSDLFDRLRTIGYPSYPKDHPQETIGFLISRLQPPVSKKEMRDRIFYDKTLDSNVKRLITTF